MLPIDNDWSHYMWPLSVPHLLALVLFLNWSHLGFVGMRDQLMLASYVGSLAANRQVVIGFFRPPSFSPTFK